MMKKILLSISIQLIISDIKDIINGNPVYIKVSPPKRYREFPLSTGNSPSQCMKLMMFYSCSALGR